MENNSRKEDLELIAAKYEFDFVQSVVGEKKWYYERALYAYETAQLRYKQYKKNNWRFWQWNNSQEHQDYLDVKRAYEEMKSSLELEERRMNEAELKVIRLTKE